MEEIDEINVKEELLEMENSTTPPDTDTDEIPTDTGIAICKVCKEACKSHSTLRKHVSKFHNAKKKYECEPCGRRFETPSNLYNHAKKFHKSAGALNPDEHRVGFKDSRYAKLKREYSELVEQNVYLEIKLRRNNEKLLMATDENKCNKIQYDTVQKEKLEIETMLKVEEKQKQDLKTDLDQKTTENEVLKFELDVMSQQLEDTKEKLAEKNDELAVCQTENVKLLKEVQDEKEKLRSLLNFASSLSQY